MAGFLVFGTATSTCRPPEHNVPLARYRADGLLLVRVHRIRQGSPLLMPKDADGR